MEAECLSALKEYAITDLNGNKPMACHFEAGTGIKIANRETAFALGYGMTKDAVNLGLPSSRLSAAASIFLSDNAALSLEWAMDSDYSSADGGSGENKQILTTQLAIEF